jgi:hypothetical protein
LRYADLARHSRAKGFQYVTVIVIVSV